MNRNLFFCLCVALYSTSLPPSLRAAEPANAADVRMREALRNTMLQLRDAQNQIAVLQAAQTEAEEKKKELAGQVEVLTRQSAADKDALRKSEEDLGTKVAEQIVEISRLQGSLDKWKVAYKEAVDAARAKEEQRARLASAGAVLQNRVDDQQARNAEMYKVAREILARYEKFGLGEAFLAREPFTGIARAKLDSLVQDYRDKLADQKIGPTAQKAPDQKPKP